MKYLTLKSDLEDKGYRCFLVPFEVGSRGHIRKSTKSNIFNIFSTMRISVNSNHCMKNMSKISLLSSYTIFHAYTQPTWRDPPFLTTWKLIEMVSSNCAADYCHTRLELGFWIQAELWWEPERDLKSHLTHPFAQRMDLFFQCSAVSQP